MELELTESGLMQDAEATVGTLQALRDLGVTLAIDDFRTGYSSFSCLRRFPVDALKLHQCFVQDIAEESGDATIVSAMIRIGTSLNQRVLAEGVETREQFLVLKSHKCGEGQGYNFSCPVAAEQTGKLMDATNFWLCQPPIRARWFKIEQTRICNWSKYGICSPWWLTRSERFDCFAGRAAHHGVHGRKLPQTINLLRVDH